MIKKVMCRCCGELLESFTAQNHNCPGKEKIEKKKERKKKWNGKERRKTKRIK